MGSGCCSETKEKTKSSSHETKHENVEEFKETYIPKKQYPNVQFDVIVPEGGEQALEKTLEKSFSLNATMHTMRDYGTSGSTAFNNNNNASILDNNMSFTNNFLEVNDAAIKQFTKSIASLAKNDKFGGASILEESMRGGKALQESAVESGMCTTEDTAYIDDGASVNEKLLRLLEVEDQTRNHLIGSWRVNFTLIQLATSRLLPTIRQRRMPWNQQGHQPPAASQGAPAAAKGPEMPQKRDKLIIHAPGVDVESGMETSVDTRPPGAAAPAAATPAAPATPATAAAAPQQNSKSEYSPPSASASLVLDRSMLRSRSEGAAPPKVEHYEMLTLTCRDIDVSKHVHSLVINDTWDFLSKSNAADALNDGKCIFRFMCQPTNAVDAETKEMIDTFINVSSFKEEERENNTPKVNINNDEEASKYIGIFVKAMYMLPGVKLSNIRPEFVSSLEYQKACQPGGPKVEQGATLDTFRVTISVIKFVFSITIQFKVSEVTDPQILASFKKIDGMVPAKALMLERTKRNVGKVDATAKVRSMLLYYPVNDGLLVNSQTLVLNTSLPKVVSKIVNTFGSQGASQSADTAKLTRRYLLDKFGDTRTNAN